MKWRSAAVTAVWAAGATVAGGLGAWSLAGLDGADGGGRPLDGSAVRRALGEAASGSAASEGSGTPGSPAPGPTTEGSPAPSATASPPSSSPSSPSATQESHRRTLRFPGGTATVECRTGDLVRLVSWSPDDGFHVEEYVRGPAPEASLELEATDDDTSGEDDATVTFRCTDGRPRTVPAPPDD